MQQIQEDIKKRSFHPVYLLYGEETYLIHWYRDKLKEAVLGDQDDMNYSVFRGVHTDPDQVREIADTLPFFQEHRMILLENTQWFKKANDFSDYLEKMPETTILVFMEQEVDKRNKLYKYVKKYGAPVEINAAGVADTKRFIVRKLQESNKVIREHTADYFLEQVENSLFNIDNELEKLIAYTGSRKEITCDDIDRVCSVMVTGQIFKMLDAAASGQKQETLRLYHDLLELKESPMSILYLLARHFNILLQVKTAPAGLSKAEMAKQIGIPPFSVGKYQTQCRHFSVSRLKSMLTHCVDTEYDFKQGKIQEQIAVELLLISCISAN